MAGDYIPISDSLKYSAGTSTCTWTNNSTWVGDPPPDWSSTPWAPYQPSIQPAIYPMPQINVWPDPWRNPERERQENEKQRAEIADQIEKILNEHLKPKKLKEGIMKVFEVIVVDKKECKVLLTQIVIAKDKETAMLDLDLTPDIRNKVKNNLIEFIFAEKGQFTKVERKVEIKELKDEE